MIFVISNARNGKHSVTRITIFYRDRLRQIISVRDSQDRFMKGKYTSDAIWIARQLQERVIEKQNMHLEKAYDKIPREWYFGACVGEECLRV